MTARPEISENPAKPESSRVRRSKHWGLLEYVLVFCVAWAVRMVHILALQKSPMFFYKIGDAAKYDAWARNLAAGNWIGEGVFYQAPLYPYFLGIIYRFFGDDILTVRRVQAFLGAIACLLIMRAASNLFGKRSGMVAGLIMALYAPSIFLEGLIQKSVLDLFFLSLLIWLFSESLSRSRGRLWLGIGIATGALCLTRENALVLIPIVLAWLVVGRIQKGVTFSATERLKWSTVFALGLLLTLGPVCLRNYYVGGQFHLTTSQLGPNFYIGNNPKANGTYQPLLPGRGDAQFEQTDAVALAEKESGRELSPREVSRFYLKKSADYILHQPIAWLQLLGFKTALTVNSNEILDTEDQYTVAQWSPILRMTNTVFHFGVLVPVALIGVFVTRRRWRSFWMLYAMAAAFALTVVMFFVFGRYRFPLVPLLIVFASPAIVLFWKRIRQKKIRPLLVMASAFLVLLAACNQRLISPDMGRGVTLSNYGVQALIRNDFQNAEIFLDEALELMPKSPLVHNNLGVLYRETDRIALAKKHFETASSLEPADARIRTNLDKLVARLETGDLPATAK